MDEWVERALARWPNVPALFGWMRLDRRGQWLVSDRVVTNPRIRDVICRNYGSDEHGRWYFQNGPQRGYVALDYTPFVLFSQPGGDLLTHNGHPVTEIQSARLDEAGGLVLGTEHGASLLHDRDLEWALSRLHTTDGPVESELEHALAQPGGETTRLRLTLSQRNLPIQRCDSDQIPDIFGFVPTPAPREEES